MAKDQTQKSPEELATEQAAAEQKSKEEAEAKAKADAEAKTKADAEGKKKDAGSVLHVKFLNGGSFKGAVTGKPYNYNAGQAIDVPKGDLAHIDKKDYTILPPPEKGKDG